MPSLIQNLIERAESISNSINASRQHIVYRLKEIKAEQDQLEADLAKINKLPHRQAFLLAAYKDGKKLCPRCSLERGEEIEMVGIGGGDESTDNYRCPSCRYDDEGEF